MGSVVGCVAGLLVRNFVLMLFIFFFLIWSMMPPGQGRISAAVSASSSCLPGERGKRRGGAEALLEHRRGRSCHSAVWYSLDLRPHRRLRSKAMKHGEQE